MTTGAGLVTRKPFVVNRNANRERNVRIFDELVAMFQARMPIPDRLEIPEIEPSIATTAFPDHILSDGHLAGALNPDRLAALRDCLDREAVDGESAVSYVAPWFDESLIQADSIDWIYSQAVMEHVDDIRFAYECCFRWLAPSGMMSHHVDFRSHGTAVTWAGHRAYSDIAWRMVRGARPYLINRLPLSLHRRILEEIGFEAVEQSGVNDVPTLGTAQLARPFREWTNEDLHASGTFLIHRKPPRPRPI